MANHDTLFLFMNESHRKINREWSFFLDKGAQASRNGHERVVRVLLEAGADVNAAAGRGGIFSGTALQGASRNGHERVVRVLLEAGADVNAAAGGRGFSGTALQQASRNGH